MSLSRMKPLRILISDGPETNGVAPVISRGFNRSRHQVEIGAISPKSFKQFDLVVPVTVSELIQVRQWPWLLKENPLPIPSEESVQLCNDKYEFSQELIRRGFESCIPRIAMDLEPPYILKKREGICGLECWMIRDREEEERVRLQLDDPGFYRQQIIRGSREFATHILFVNGKIVKSLNIMYEFESDMPVKGPDQPLNRVIHRCPYLALFARVLASIGFEGLCCVNYKVAGGQPYILEINPRLGSSLSPYFFSFVRSLTLPRAASSWRWSVGTRSAASLDGE